MQADKVFGAAWFRLMMGHCGIVDHLVFDAIVILKVEPPPGLIVAVAVVRESLRKHSSFDRVQMINNNRDVVEV